MFSLKPNPLIALWVPGFSTLAAIIFFRYHEEIYHLLLQSPSPAVVGALGFAVVVFGFVLGNFLDAVRDLFEHIIDRFFPRIAIPWNFFVSAEKEKVENLEEWFYTYYELDANLVLGIILVLVLSWCSILPIDCWVQMVMSLALIILSLSSWLLRKEVKKRIDEYSSEKQD